jgi:hypothetical protein
MEAIIQSEQQWLGLRFSTHKWLDVEFVDKNGGGPGSAFTEASAAKSFPGLEFQRSQQRLWHAGVPGGVSYRFPRAP